MSNIFGNLFKKTSNSKEIIIVSGLPRSGTSMMMKILEAGGLKILTDNTRSADNSNPNGYYEFERVKALKTGDFDWLPQAQGKVVKVISALLEFLPGQYSYKVIFMRREMDEVLSSQRQMMKRDGKLDDAGNDGKLSMLYGDHLDGIKKWLGDQPNIATLYVSYNQTLENPETELQHVNQFLGGNLSLRSMLAVVDPRLYRERI
jgi:hypothetical protein